MAGGAALLREEFGSVGHVTLFRLKHLESLIDGDLRLHQADVPGVHFHSALHRRHEQCLILLPLRIGGGHCGREIGNRHGMAAQLGGQEIFQITGCPGGKIPQRLFDARRLRPLVALVIGTGSVRTRSPGASVPDAFLIGQPHERSHEPPLHRRIGSFPQTLDQGRDHFRRVQLAQHPQRRRMQ